MPKSSKTAFAVFLGVGLVLAACLFVAVVRCAGRDCVVTELWLPDVLKMKRLFAERTPSPRIIVSAGSGAMFGVDSKVLSEALDMPVVNMALHAALPLEFYCNELRHIARKGDVIVMPLEIHNFYDMRFWDKVSKDFPISLIFGIAPEYAQTLSPGELALFYSRYGLEWICRNVRGQTHRSSASVAELEKKWLADRGNDGYGGYEFNGLSERGDMLVKRPGLPLPDKKWDVPSSLSESFVSTWKDFTAQMKHRGVRVILTWSNLLWYPDREGFENLRKLLATESIELHGRPEAFSFPKECYYDTHFHLNAYGAALNATELARVVAPILGRCLRQNADSCSHMALAENCDLTFPEMSNAHVYASGVKFSGDHARLHAMIPRSLVGKAARLNMIVTESGTNGVAAVSCRGERLRVQHVEHAFRDEITVAMHRDMMSGDAVDLDFELSGPVGFERLSWLGAAPAVRFCSGFVGEWTIGDRAEVELAVPQELRGKSATLKLSLKPSEEKISVFCGNVALGQYDLTWAAVELKIPIHPQLTNDEIVRIRIDLERVKSPKERGWSTDARKLGPRVVSIGLER